MAIVSTASNHFKYQLASKKIDFASDTFKIILMNDTFTFNKDTHSTLSGVTDYQLTTGSGYTQNEKALEGVSVTEDDTNDRAYVTWDDVTWTSTGSIGPIGALIIYDDDTDDDTVVGCTDFGSDYTVTSGNSIQIQQIMAYIN